MSVGKYKAVLLKKVKNITKHRWHFHKQCNGIVFSKTLIKLQNLER
jgi:hypothetical protein